eukprot:gene22699-23935_t
MAHFSDYASLIAAFGAKIGLDMKPTDEARHVVLDVDGREISIDFDEINGQVLVFLEVGQLSARPSVEEYERVCELNLGFLFQSRFGLGVNAATQSVVLVSRTPLQGLDADGLVAAVESAMDKRGFCYNALMARSSGSSAVATAADGARVATGSAARKRDRCQLLEPVSVRADRGKLNALEGRQT